MSKFDDDMARGCLPTGEPLECLYGVGWWTEHDEPEPDPYDLHIAELESRIAELEAERRWIPVSERLPKEKQSVLALDRTGTAYHWEYSRSLSNIFVSDYTHWMPLPEPPEVKDE